MRSWTPFRLFRHLRSMERRTRRLWVLVRRFLKFHQASPTNPKGSRLVSLPLKVPGGSGLAGLGLQALAGEVGWAEALKAVLWVP